MILICTQLFDHTCSTTKIEISPHYQFVETITGLKSWTWTNYTVYLLSYEHYCTKVFRWAPLTHVIALIDEIARCVCMWNYGATFYTLHNNWNTECQIGSNECCTFQDKNNENIVHDDKVKSVTSSVTGMTMCRIQIILSLSIHQMNNRHNNNLKLHLYFTVLSESLN